MAEQAYQTSEPGALESALDALRGNLPSCLLVAVVDQRRSRLLGSSAASGFENALVELIATASAELFRSPSGQHDGDGENTSEVVTASRDLFHVFLRCPQAPELTLVAICRASINLGMLMTKLRVLVETLDSSHLDESATFRRL
jgi:hypothetical protein